MIIAIFPHTQKRESKNLAIGVQVYLTARGATVVAPDDFAASLGVPPMSSVPHDQIEFFISMGGDGTILGLVHLFANITPAIISINLGHLGFMPDIPA